MTMAQHVQASESLLLQQYRNTRAYSESLCKPLHIEDYVPQPVEYTSPPKWSLAHVTWFFETFILKTYMPNYQVFHPEFYFLFNSYYQTVGERAVRPQRGLMTRPTVEEVYAYRAYVNEHMHKLLSQPISPEIQSLIILGINHEQQHQELLITDLKYTFSLNPSHPVYHPDFNLVADKNTSEGWLHINEGVYEIGHQGDGFCYDNELQRHKIFLHDFQICKALATNAEYMVFIEDGGYSNFNHWHDDAWNWLNTNNIQHPLYWQKTDGLWYHYTLAGLKPVAPNAILSHISYYEAHAFANWKNMRLPTGFEWEVASQQLDWGKRWEWTSSAYQPYPNFSIGEGAIGEYNGKFMVNQMVLRGASSATSQGHSRHTYRNFFHPQLQWQYSGIRLVQQRKVGDIS